MSEFIVGVVTGFFVMLGLLTLLTGHSESLCEARYNVDDCQYVVVPVGE